MKKTIATVLCRSIPLGLTVLVVFSTTGCATGIPKSGFLADYSTLEELPEDAPYWEYVDPDGRKRQLNARVWADRKNWRALGNYDRIMVDPVVVQFREHAKGAWVSPKRLEEITTYMYDSMVSALEDRYAVVDEPSEGVVRIRLAITDVYPEYVYKTPDLDRHPGKAWANSRPGGATIEAEAIDSVTGERIAALVSVSRGSYYDAMDHHDRWEHAKRSIDGGTKFFRKMMDEAHEPQ